MQIKFNLLKKMSKEELKKIEDDINNMKNMINQLFQPENSSNTLNKLSQIEQKFFRFKHELEIQHVFMGMTTFLLIIVILCFIYILWRLQYFKLIHQHNLFRRFFPPRKCYACYRPWRNKRFKKTEYVEKSSFSSPEFNINEQIQAPYPDDLN
jgi:uncharacterized membrane protein (DUF106 family)